MTTSPATISCDADTKLDSAAPTTNYGTGTALDIGWLKLYTDVCRGLFTFTIPSDIPSAQVKTAKLTLQALIAPAVGAASHVCRLTRSDWAETQATWNIYKTSNNWTAAGGDFTTTAQVAWNMPTATGSFDITGLAALVQDAIDSRSRVLHLLLKADTESGGTDSTLNVASKDNATPAYRPVLVITFATPADLTLQPAYGVASAGNLVLSTPAPLSLGSASGSANASLSLLSAASLALNPAYGIANAALQFTSPAILALDPAYGVGSASLNLQTPALLILDPSYGVASAGDVLIATGALLSLDPSYGVGSAGQLVFSVISLVAGRLYVQIFDVNGNLLGSGPIFNLDKVSLTSSLDKGGQFSFQMPATDERASLIEQGRKVLIFREGEGQIGAGLIEAKEIE